MALTITSAVIDTTLSNLRIEDGLIVAISETVVPERGAGAVCLSRAWVCRC